MGQDLTFVYRSPGVIADAFLKSESFVTGIRGPVGSGKSTACVMKLLSILHKQPVAQDGRKHARFAVIRNTYPELTTTTIKTWHQWIPDTFGQWKAQGPPTHRIIDDQHDLEVLFLALDSPDDVRKLLSLELTGAWINEAREVQKPILDALTGRVGRYPPKRDGGCISPQIVMDTNSPEIDHWWYVLAESDTTSARNAELVESVREAEAKMRAEGQLTREQSLFTFLAQPDANSPDAENRVNLPSDYYAKMSAGKTDEWKKVYIRAEYGFVQDGRPVYPEFREYLHVKEFELNPKLPLDIGIDFGNTPAAAIGQRSFSGIQRVRWEIVTEHMGAKQFAETLKGFLAQTCPNFEIGSITGDPAGDHESQQDIDMTCFKILRANGINARPAPTNDPRIRQEAHKQAMTRLIDGQAGYQIHPGGCPVLRRGMAGQYRYKRIQIAGSEQFHVKPEKNAVSHICEADQYRMLGVGEGRAVLRGAFGPNRVRPPYAIM
jgi:hypothetical protein